MAGHELQVDKAFELMKGFEERRFKELEQK